MVAGQNFVAGSKVMFGGVPLATTFASRSQLQATGTSTAAQEGTVQIAVQNPDPRPSTSTHSAGAQRCHDFIGSRASSVRAPL
jgi:hypothetical protein